jgi:hypothetical protein
VRCAGAIARAGDARGVHAASAGAGRFRFIVARGELTDRTFPETGTVNGAFRFADGPVEAAWARWAGAGSTTTARRRLVTSPMTSPPSRHLGIRP